MSAELDPELVDKIFLHARELSGEERELYLAQVCGDDNELRKKVEILLEADEAAARDRFWNDEPTATIPTVPEKVGHYRIERELGKGGFGHVYLGWDEHLTRRVAIKIPRSDSVADPDQFIIEARNLAAIVHPNIVRIYDFGRTADGVYYAVYEYIEGDSIAVKLKKARIDHRFAATLMAKVARALAHVHATAIYHRDIKPANIILDAKDEPHLADFGLAVSERDWSLEPEISGTPEYMSPEQARGEAQFDARSDIFSLGAVFYELLTRRIAFAGNGVIDVLARVQTKDPRPPRELDSSITPELQRICLTALAKDPNDRFQTAIDLAERLEQFLVEPPKREREGQVADARQVTHTIVGRGDEPPPGKFVPQGLHSFTSLDQSFYPKLLPPPYRDGLPESIGTWKRAIESRERSFRVGILYGPSGCGKSSLMQAGLIPRLADHVVSQYIEADAKNTERRVRTSLTRLATVDASDLPLTEIVRHVVGIQSQTNRKCLLVLDQFERWLHAHQRDRNTELIDVLRSCDGIQLQAVLLVRDDFWMPISRLIEDFEFNPSDDLFLRPFDRFDRQHAENVLAEFGLAYNRLPTDASAMTPAHLRFLEQAIQLLQEEDGTVVPLRISLFALMMMDKDWHPSHLEPGFRELGRTFLKRQLDPPHGRPLILGNRKGVIEILKSLLPPSGTNIAATMQSREALKSAFGIDRSERTFDAILSMLTNELRVITPAVRSQDDASLPPSSESVAKEDESLYKLTHDSLVLWLRDWLNEDLKQTWHGKAIVRLRDLSHSWSLEPEPERDSRYLPNWSEHPRIRAAIKWRHHNPTAAEADLLKAALKHHSKWLAAICAFLLITFGIFWMWKIRTDEARDEKTANELVDEFVQKAHAEAVSRQRGQLDEYRRWTIPRLTAIVNQESANARVWQAHLALLYLIDDNDKKSRHVDALYEHLLSKYCDWDDFELVGKAIMDSGEAVRIIDDLRSVFQSRRPKEQATDNSDRAIEIFRAGVALVAFGPKAEWNPKDYAFLAIKLVQVPPGDAKTVGSLLEPIAEGLRPTLRFLVVDQNIKLEGLDLPEEMSGFWREMAARFIVEYYPTNYELHCDCACGTNIKSRFEILIPFDDLRKQPEMISGLRAALEEIVKDPAASRYEVQMAKQPPTTFVLDTSGDEPEYVLQRPPLPVDKKYSAQFPEIRSDPEVEQSESRRVRLGSKRAKAAIALLRIAEIENRLSEYANRVFREMRVLEVDDDDKGIRDPEAQTQFIHSFREFGIDAEMIWKAYDTLFMKNGLDWIKAPGVLNDTRYALLICLGKNGKLYAESDNEELLVERVNEDVLAHVETLYLNHPDSGIHGAARWLLTRWKMSNADVMHGAEEDEIIEIANYFSDLDQKILGNVKYKDKGDWIVRRDRGTIRTFVKCEKDDFNMGTSPSAKHWRLEWNLAPNEPQAAVKIERPFAICIQEVTRGEFNAFREAMADSANTKDQLFCRELSQKHFWEKGYQPMGEVRWFDAVQFCRWLTNGDAETADAAQCYGELSPDSSQCEREKKELFSVHLGYEKALEYEKALDSGVIPKSLREDFEENELSLLSDASVTVINMCKEWHVHHPDTDLFLLEKTPANLSIYKSGIKNVTAWNVDEERFGFRLPFEKEWHYACAADMDSSFYFGSDYERTKDYAWFLESRDTLESKWGCQKIPNRRGLFDMHGNMYEWCDDYGFSTSSKAKERKDPEQNTERRVLRGGGWQRQDFMCRSGWRYRFWPNSLHSGFGFRLVFTLDEHPDP